MNRDGRCGRIIVLGMHRSGTSCVGGLLAAMGAYFGPSEMNFVGHPDNPLGFFERREMQRLCRSLLKAAGADWWSVSGFSADRVPPAARRRAGARLAPVLSSLEAHCPWFVKEPRLCLLLPVLREHLGPAVLIHVWREPLEVAESLRKRDGFSIDFGLALWEYYIRSSFANGKPDVIVSYNRLIDDPTGSSQRLLACLTAVGVRGLRMPAPETLARVIAPDLRRSIPVSSVSQRRPSPEQRALLAALQSGDPANPAFFEPVSPKVLETLNAGERAYRDRIRLTYQSTVNARIPDEARPTLKRISQAARAVRYLPWNVMQWLRWYRRDKLRHHLRKHLDAVAIAARGTFDSAGYLERYPDVAAARIDPLLHYVLHGVSEGRAPVLHVSAKVEGNPQLSEDRAGENWDQSI